MKVCGQIFSSVGVSFRVGDKVSYRGNVGNVIGWGDYNLNTPDSLIITFDSGETVECFIDNCSHL